MVLLTIPVVIEITTLENPNSTRVAPRALGYPKLVPWDQCFGLKFFLFSCLDEVYLKYFLIYQTKIKVYLLTKALFSQMCYVA